MKRILYAGATIAVLAALAIVIVGWQTVSFLDSPINVPADGISYEIKPGTAFASLSDELGDRGVISRPRLFRWYARLTGVAGKVHAGEYHIDAGTTPSQLLQKFVAGDVRLHIFTIIEGWTYRDLISGLRRHKAVTHTLADDGSGVLKLLETEATHPEGLFLPETYRFPKGTRDVEILQRAHVMLTQALEAEWNNRAPDLPLEDPYEALILASIIERETGRADERQRIAGVFVRRLQKGMRLQTDPTVIYGIGPGFDGNLTRRDLRTSTPYNTYTESGLPPTPIAMPGRAAIHAAVNPAPGPELYFVATGFPDGSHKFSATMEEHEAAVAEYLVRLRQSRSPADGNGSR